MPRPRTVSDEAILDAVLDLALRIGPARLTFSAVAAEVGLSAATLVQRFGTKRDLLLSSSVPMASPSGDCAATPPVS